MFDVEAIKNEINCKDLIERSYRMFDRGWFQQRIGRNIEVILNCGLSAQGEITKIYGDNWYNYCVLLIKGNRKATFMLHAVVAVIEDSEDVST